MRERGFYEQASDEELVEEFLRTSDNWAKEKLFERYFEKFDQIIRAVLHHKGVPYSPDAPYYHEVFPPIYERVFGKFQNIASGFNRKKGSFERYFLRVAKNATIDWLREKDPEKGITHEEDLQWQAKQKEKEVGLVVEGKDPEGTISPGQALELKAEEEERLERVVDGPSTNDPPCQEPKEQIEEAIRALDFNHRVIMRLLLLDFLDIGQEEIETIARETLGRAQGHPSEIKSAEIQKKGGELAETIRRVKKRLLEEREERKGLLFWIEFLERRIDLFEGKARKKARDLEKNFGHDPESLRKIHSGLVGMTFQEINKRREELLREYCAGQIDAYAYGEGKLICDYQEALKKIQKEEKRLGEEWKKAEGKKKKEEEWLPEVIPTDKEMLEVLEIPEGTLSSRKSRAKEKFQTALREGMEGKG